MENIPTPRPRSLPRRNIGFMGSISTVLLRPGVFFRNLTPSPNDRQWLWAGLLIVGLAGLAAVRREAVMAASAADFAFSGVSSPNTISTTLTTALIAASGLIVGWVIQSLLLVEVWLFRGMRPHVGLNLRVAIWASVPLGLMAAVQIAYYAVQGLPGEPGLVGLMLEWPGYISASPVLQAVLKAFAAHFTLFWLWQMLLLYLGALHTLRGKWWSSLLVVVAWIMVQILMPALITFYN